MKYVKLKNNLLIRNLQFYLFSTYTVLLTCNDPIHFMVGPESD